MRNAELRQLQVADIDSRRMLIHIQQGQGRPRSVRAAQPDAARRRCARTTGGCGRRRGCFRARSRGWRADKPITPKVALGCLSWSPPTRAGFRKRVSAASAAPFLRDAPAGERRRPAHDPAAARARRARGTPCIYLHLSQRHLQAVANPLDALPISAPDTARADRAGCTSGDAGHPSRWPTSCADTAIASWRRTARGSRASIGACSARSRSAARRRSAGIAIAVSSVRSRPSRTTAAGIGIARSA